MKTKRLTIKQIKQKLLQWEDFYGQDLVDTDGIKKCKTKSDCYDILMSHKRHIERQNLDAFNDLEVFAKKLGVPYR